MIRRVTPVSGELSRIRVSARAGQLTVGLRKLTPTYVIGFRVCARLCKLSLLNPQILQNHLATYVRCLPRFIISRLRPAIPVAPARDLKRFSLNTKQIDIDISKLKARHAPVDLQVEGTANAAG